jgi:hypothetical protein
VIKEVVPFVSGEDLGKAVSRYAAVREVLRRGGSRVQSLRMESERL